MQQGESALILKMQSLYDSMSKTERKAADYILAHASEVIRLSISELAERSGVSDATVVRLCKRMGMRGYQELKVLLAQDIASPLDDIHQDVRADDAPEIVFDKVFCSAMHSLQYTMHIVDRQQVARAVDLIDRARRVGILGLGASMSVAHDMHIKLTRLGIAATTYTDAHLQSTAASYFTREDVIFAISLSGRSHDIIDAVRLARQNGCPIVCMCNIGQNMLAELADVRLDTACKQSSQYRIVDISSRIAQYTMIDALYTMLALRRSGFTQPHQQAFERALEKKKY
nr:MurR/RpiR family transcriptional regulator [Maliibacterium massiliense]